MAQHEPTAEAAATSDAVVPIRASVAIPARNRPEDGETVTFARLSASCAEQADRLAETEPDSEAHRLALHMVGIDRKLPRNNLRCVVSTLDEQRDFDLRVAEAEIAKAEHALGRAHINRISVLEGDANWWDSPTQRPLVEENNRRWDHYRVAVMIVADTPARTVHQLERKRRLIGNIWLKAEGEWYDRLRAGVARDEAWLAVNAPAKKRRARA